MRRGRAKARLREERAMSTSTAEAAAAKFKTIQLVPSEAEASRAARRRLPAGRAFWLERVDLRPPHRARAGAGAALPHQPLRAALRRGEGVEPGQDHARGRDRGPRGMAGERSRLRHPRRDPQGGAGRALRHAHALAGGHGGGGAGMRAAADKPGCDPLPRHGGLSRVRGRGGERGREGAAWCRTSAATARSSSATTASSPWAGPSRKPFLYLHRAGDRVQDAGGRARDEQQRSCMCRRRSARSRSARSPISPLTWPTSAPWSSRPSCACWIRADAGYRE